METAMKQVTKIEANPLLLKNKRPDGKLKVAAYCRVSTDDDEQLNSYEAQITYYTETISKNPSWIFAGIYADEGITGTQTQKRKDFLRLMSDCEKGKVNLILTKSISRFARNTVDSLSWVRRLKAMNVGVYFEEQALDSLKAENEMLIGLFSVIAQAESENISSNVKWGIQQSMKKGLFGSNFNCYGYKKGEDGIPVIVPEQAEVVKKIYDLYLDGNTIGQIQEYLMNNKIKTLKGNEIWSKQIISNMLHNEKYVGDLLLQKTYRTDCLTKKVQKNKGEFAQYLVSNNHPAIIDRSKFKKVQMETARRSSKSKRASKTITEQARYSGKYALSELLICGECGSYYRRREKNKNGKKLYFWRCINRMENGKERCEGIGVEEQKLHAAIYRCINKAFTQKDETIRLLKTSVEAILLNNDSSMNIHGIENQIISLEEDSEFLMQKMMDTGGDTEKYMKEIENNFSKVKALREQLDVARTASVDDEYAKSEAESIINSFQNANIEFDSFDNIVVRRLIECIKVMKDRRIIVTFKGGFQEEEMI